MIISDKKQFIFVHVEKTGGSSICAALAPYANRRPDGVGASFLRALGLPADYRSYRFRAHAPLADAERKMPVDRFHRYYKFAFVRNPWCRLASEYNAALSKRTRSRHHRIAAFGEFEEFVRYEIRRNKFRQLPRLCRRDGEIGVDFIGRFESLQRDFATVCERLGVLVELSHLNGYAHPDYRDYYGPVTRDLVFRHWRRDIEAFGYEF